jgi:6-phosphogluconolactonase
VLAVPPILFTRAGLLRSSPIQSAKFAYVINPPSLSAINPNHSIVAHRIGSVGELKPVPNSSFGTGGFGTAIDPTGKFLYVTNTGVSGYTIGANGELTPIPGSPLASGNSPEPIAITSQ